MAKEKLIDIVNILDSCANARKGTGIAPVARVHCTYDGEPDSFWFTNDIVNYYRYKEVKKFGHFVPKNSAVAIKMRIGLTFKIRLLLLLAILYYISTETSRNFSQYYNRTGKILLILRIRFQSFASWLRT